MIATKTILTNVIQKDGIFFIVTWYLYLCSSPTDKVIYYKFSKRAFSCPKTLDCFQAFIWYLPQL